MLYDPKWEKKVETKDNLASLIAWLEKQPPETEYNYCDPFGCLIAQYRKAQGITPIDLNADEVKQLGWAEIVHPIGNQDWTFGGALKRARALVRRS